MDTAIAQPSSAVVSHSYDANMYTLRSRQISISFSATSITGQPLLHYKDRTHEVNLRGKEIRMESSEIGTLVTIPLEPDTDAGELLFTLVVPNVSLKAVGEHQAIKTLGFFTRSRQLPRLPASAQLQTYDAVELKGSATFVFS